jgi:hypothetical protein
MSNEPNGDQNISVLEENKTKAEETKEAANKLFNGLKLSVVFNILRISNEAVVIIFDLVLTLLF